MISWRTLLPIESSGSLDELEYAMPHYQRAVYTAIFKKLQDKISSILSQPPIQVSHFVPLEDPLLIALYNFHRRLSIQHKIASTLIRKFIKIAEKNCLKLIIENMDLHIWVSSLQMTWAQYAIQDMKTLLNTMTMTFVFPIQI